MNPFLTYTLLTLFFTCVVSGLVLFRATVNLAKWLFYNRREIWLELGRPGTFLFRGDPDNGYWSRTSALNSMYRSMPLYSYRRLQSDLQAQRYLRQYILSNRIFVLFLILFVVGVFYGGISRDADSNLGSTTNSGQITDKHSSSNSEHKAEVRDKHQPEAELHSP
jgi:hypothetical protein